jgi:hypothetical protein
VSVAAPLFDMSTTIKEPNRQKSGQPTGGRFAERDWTADAITLHGQGYPHVNTPNQDQYRRGQEAAARSAAWAGIADSSEYHRTIDTFAHDIADQEAAYEAFKSGATHDDDAKFDVIWAGGSPGMSKTIVELHLMSATADHNSVTAGHIPEHLIADVSGSETPNELALHQTQERIDLYAEAIRSSGKSLSINQAAVVRARKAQERAEAPF